MSFVPPPSIELLAADRNELKRIQKRLRKALPDYAINGSGDSIAPTGDLERLRLFFREQYARMLAHDPGVRLGEDAEDLHQLRVAARRVRSILRTARPILETEWVDRLRAELEWLGDELGIARDLDVLIDELREEAETLDADDRAAFEPALDQLERDRARARECVLEALRSERYFALLATLEEAGAAPPPGQDDTSLRAATRKEFRRLSKAMDKVAEDPSDELIHKARIKGKRARYAAELVEDELGKRGAKVIAAAKRFQDVAGEHQDSVVAEERLRALARSRRAQRTALAAGLLVGRQRERRARAADELPKAWKRVEKAAKKAWA